MPELTINTVASYPGVSGGGNGSTVSSLLMPELTINTVVSYPGVSGGGGGGREGTGRLYPLLLK